MKNIHKIIGVVNVVALVITVIALLLVNNLAPSAIIIVILLLSAAVFGWFIYINFRIQWQKSFKNIALMTVNLLWLLIMAALVFSSFQIDTTLRKISDMGCTEECSEAITLDEPVAVYISGEDSFGEVDEQSRSDVNQIAVINPEKSKVLLVNTPRDYYVQLHSYGPLPDKLTHAGGFGVAESMMTLSDLYDIEMTRYVKVNFTSLVKLVDILGGITVNSDVDFVDYKGNHYTAGANELDSAKALAFSRERKAFNDGDRQRGKNQQKVIEAIFNKLKTSDALFNYQEIFASISTDLRTNILGNDIKKIVQSMIKNQYQFETISVTGTGAMLPTYSYPWQNLYVMQPDLESLEAAKAKINEHLVD